ncbi:HNH endonuclease signature motif containing protein [Mycolicibacter minnesotensis]
MTVAPFMVDASAIPVLTTDEDARFWAKVERTGHGGCWLWTASTTSRGYGCYRLTRTMQTYLVHRIAWTITRFPVPEGFTLDHTCQNRRCVNPEHLEMVTLRVNSWRGAGTRWSELMQPTIRRIVAHPSPSRIPAEDVPELLGLSPRSLRRVIADGELAPALGWYGARYHHRLDLIRFVMNRAAEDAGAPVLQAVNEMQRSVA